MRRIFTFLLGLAIGSRCFAAPAEYFAIHVVDDQTGRGVPLVELRSTFKARYVTDSAGYIAFSEPGLMSGDDVWFDVQSYGYESPRGALGAHGMALKPSPGTTVEIKLHRTQVAERLYRLTGYGIYRDSVLLGKPVPIKEPLLDARVTGQDTVQTAVYRGKYYWMWGDTDQIGFALGRFAMTGALAPPPDKIDPNHGIDFVYFVEKKGELARNMADIPQDAPRPVWLDGLTVVKDEKGEERMLARYAAVDPAMKPVETGLCLFNDERQCFERFKRFAGNGAGTLAPSGRPYREVDGGVHYVCFTDGVRVRETFAAASDPEQYESFTCLKDNAVDRSSDGHVVWAWRRGAPRLARDKIESLLKSGALKRDECAVDMRDADTGKPVRVASGSIAWNPYLKLWTYVYCEAMGESALGEIWFATAKSPEGPWRAARKVATHARPRANMDLYNIIQHEDLIRGDGAERGRFFYFEGTFVNTFSGTVEPTPYYNYNNLMYRIDLADPRMKLPVPPTGLTAVQPSDRWRSICVDTV